MYKGERRLTSLQWHQDTSIEARFRGHKSDQAQQGSVIVHTRDDASGTRSGVGAGGGAVTLTVELRSVYPTMPESVPLSSYRCGNEVRVRRYAEAFAALHQVAAKAEDDSSEVGLYSLRIGAATTLAAAGGGVTEGDPEGRRLRRIALKAPPEPKNTLFGFILRKKSATR